MKRGLMALVAVLVLAAVGGGAYYYGTQVGEKRVLANPQLVFQQLGEGQGGRFQRQFEGQGVAPSGTPQAGQRGMVIQGGGVMGTIKEIDGNTLVITTDDGDVRVQASDTTLIQKTMSVNVGDLEVDERVVVSGTKNDDGSYTARSIQSVQGMQLESSQP